MNSIIVDTNPLVYIYNDVQELGGIYAILLGKLAKKNALLIPKIVYGELSLIFRDDKELDTFLNDTGIMIGEIKSATYITAAKRWQQYNSRRILMCHRCGTKIETMICKKCKANIKVRQHILPDFIIGAYALEVKGQNIVTGDTGYYSTYFPELNIITTDQQQRRSQ